MHCHIAEHMGAGMETVVKVAVRLGVGHSYFLINKKLSIELPSCYIIYNGISDTWL